uniref:uncharacterized protein LOC113475140 n=1 Tax=Ciona intestinalis TaxID=7719 RepID=UPI000EF46FF6|nr:uncharacterized protein LOC113475140 [Ciona intestinalis]|eukprot:XP_026694634.1 uncharacterized protein LOC113475140 [Ciona intestinalis]
MLTGGILVRRKLSTVDQKEKKKEDQRTWGVYDLHVRGRINPRSWEALGVIGSLVVIGIGFNTAATDPGLKGAILMGVGLFLLIISVAALLQQRDKNSVVIIMKDLYTMYIEAYTDRFGTLRFM